MSERAKLFRNGGSQAVRLPKSFRFRDDQDEVIVRRVGKRVVLEPADEWSEEFLSCLGAWKQDIPRPKTGVIGKRTHPFDRDRA
jgi:antitoxin VapB